MKNNKKIESEHGGCFGNIYLGNASSALRRDVSKTELIMQKLDSGYHDMKRDQYPPFALTAWDDRNRYREYVRRVLERLEKEGEI